MNELRRDPMSGRWAIIEHKDSIDFKTLLSRKQTPHKKQFNECPFCEGNERKLKSEILALRSHDSVENGPGWDVRVVPDPNPILETRGAMDHDGTDI